MGTISVKRFVELNNQKSEKYFPFSEISVVPGTAAGL